MLEISAPADALGKYPLELPFRILAGDFAGTRVLGNTVDPDRIDTHPEFGSDHDDITPGVAVHAIVDAATLPTGGPNGELFREGSWG